MTSIEGFIEPGFGPVKEAFAANFAEHGEIGAAVCVYVHGRPVVDLWGGVADQPTGRAWDEDTLQLVFSTTKGVTAICANLLAEQGELDLDAPVREMWPEFGAAGKAEVTTRWLLSHQAGLPVVEADLTLEEVLAWEPVVDALAQQAPQWEPGTTHGYHALTFGWLVGEVIRRVSGRSVGRFFAEEIATPLNLELWIGLPDEEQARVTRLEGGLRPDGRVDPEVQAMIDQFLGADTLLGRALYGPGGVFRDHKVWNRPDVRAAEIPAANGVGTARSLARLYAAVIGEVDGVRVLGPDTVEDARKPQVEGPDRVIFYPMRWGLGFMLASDTVPLLGPGSFGHAGAGGSLAFADPEARVSFAYVMNRMKLGLAGDNRAAGLIAAVRACL